MRPGALPAPAAPPLSRPERALTGFARILVVQRLRLFLSVATESVVIVEAGADPQLRAEDSPRGHQPREHPQGKRLQPHLPREEGHRWLSSWEAPRRGRRSGVWGHGAPSGRERAGRPVPRRGLGGGRGQVRSGSGRARGQAASPRPSFLRLNGSAAPGSGSRAQAPRSPGSGPARVPHPIPGAALGGRDPSAHQRVRAESGDRGRGWGADIPAPPDLKSRRSSTATGCEKGESGRIWGCTVCLLPPPHPGCLFTLFLT